MPIIKIPPVLLLILFFLGGCKTGTKISRIESTAINMEETIDSSIYKTILPYKVKLDREMNEVLIEALIPITKGQPESELGNLVADLIFKEANNKARFLNLKPADICLLNNGGLRTSIPKGPVTLSKVYELMPFENEIVIVTLNGKKFKNLLDYVAASEGLPVSGLKMGIKNGKPVDVLIGKNAFDENREYRVITSDYLSSGGDKMFFFSDPINTENLKYLLRDAIVNNFKELKSNNQNLNPVKDGRIYFND